MSSSASGAQTVFVFGSAHQDFVLSVEALPTSGETILARDLSRGFGGKGANQAIAAARAGGRVTFVGMVGDDEWAERILDNLVSHGIDTTFVGRRTDQPTGLAVVVVDDEGSNQIVVASGAGGFFASETIRSAGDTIRHDDVVVVQCEIPADVVEQVVRAGSRAGAIVVLNLAPFVSLPLGALSAASVIVVNESEARAIVGDGVADDRLAIDVVEATGTACIVTLGASGSVYASPLGELVAVPAQRVENVVDTTGAGDVYVGTFGAHLAAGDDIRTAMAAASFAAAESVLSRGAQARQPESTGEPVG